MRHLGLPLLWLFAALVLSEPSRIPTDCAGRNAEDDEACQRPLADITEVDPGAFYVAKLPCPGCEVVQVTEEGHGFARVENTLFYNISLGRSNRLLLLNDKPIFPNLLNPTPPHVYVEQVPPSFARADLDNVIECTQTPCDDGSGSCRCMEFQSISTVSLDFDYSSHWLGAHPETKTEEWEITVDAIGAHSGWMGERPMVFNNSAQLMLRIVVEGKEVTAERFAGEKDLQAANDLFSAPEKPDRIFSYDIAKVELVKRSYTFPPPRKLGLWGRIRHYFGRDIVRPDGHIVYLQDEWGLYGKKGTLRDQVGVILYDWPWDTVGIILGSTAAGAVLGWIVYKLILLVQQQRGLARWDGMDAVWERLRRDRTDGDEAEEGLLEGGYRDDPEEGGPSRYTDEPDTNKPLPSKPLPEKPLPAVPLIDA